MNNFYLFLILENEYKVFKVKEKISFFYVKNNIFLSILINIK